MKTGRGFILAILLFLSFPFPIQAQSTELIVQAGDLIKIRDKHVFGRICVHSEGEIKVDLGDAHPFDPDAGKLEFVANSIDLKSGGRFNVSYTFGEKGQQRAAAVNHGGNGGCYGGRGGTGTPEEQIAPYGNADQPIIMRGSYGGNGPGNVIQGGMTGGALILRGETVTIDGEISSNGTPGQSWIQDYAFPAPERYFGGGGGSGGGILIIARNLTIGPDAKITANGGNGGDGWGVGGGYEGYPGGGGRIKIFYENGTIDETAVIEAIAGTPPEGGYKGGVEDGTIHIEQVKSIDYLLHPTDANGDGKTDYKDLFILHQNWQNQVTPIPTAVGQ